MPTGVIGASLPPANTTSARSRRMASSPSPSAIVEAAQAVHWEESGPFVPSSIETRLAPMFGMIAVSANGLTRSGPRCSRVSHVSSNELRPPEWDATLTYETNQIVSYLGSSWIALRRNSGQLPQAGADWNLLAQKGDVGVQGERGERGAEGPQGIQGLPGADCAPGFSPAFPASTIFTVPATGRLTIADPNVRADSVVIAVYVGGSLLPPAVTHIGDGQIGILALPGKRIRYVVFK